VFATIRKISKCQFIALSMYALTFLGSYLEVPDIIWAATFLSASMYACAALIIEAIEKNRGPSVNFHIDRNSDLS